jgi:hypothetical protein
MVDRNLDIDGSLDRVWKQFGKQTQAGKLLYDLYGVRYRPEKFVNYPKLVMKQKVVTERPSSSTKLKNAVQKINYPEVINYKPQIQLSKVDLIPKRKKENVIKKELENIKESMYRANSQNKISTNRKNQIESLQDKFMFQERTVMPKGARLPGVKNPILNEELAEKPIRMSKREELQYLYSQIIKEIDERYVYMEEIKQLGQNKDNIIMGEIKERLYELKKIKKMLEEIPK